MGAWTLLAVAGIGAFGFAQRLVPAQLLFIAMVPLGAVGLLLTTAN